MKNGEKMKFDSEDERQAFILVCEMASEYVHRKICTDLDEHNLKLFNHLKVSATDVDGSTIMSPVVDLGDVLWWLECRANVLQGDEK
jgi:hypothetical protein